MPKIRGVKPDLWTDEDFVELSPFARLLWIGMWNYCCDNGHLDDKSKQIKMRVLPTDDVNVAELLRELELNHRIVRENGTITVPNFVKHQRPDKRYFQTCDAPGCTRPDGDSQRETRGAHHERTTSARSGPDVGSMGPLGEMRGDDGDGDSERTRASARRAIQLPPSWKPSDSHRAWAETNRLDVLAEAEQFTDHHRARGTTMKDWDAAFRTWLRNAVKWRKDTPPLSVVSDPSQLPPVEESWMRRRPQ